MHPTSSSSWNLPEVCRMYIVLVPSHYVFAVTWINLQIDEHGDVEEERADGDGGDVHGEVAPPWHSPQVDAVPETVKCKWKSSNWSLFMFQLLNKVQLHRILLLPWDRDQSVIKSNKSQKHQVRLQYHKVGHWEMAKQLQVTESDTTLSMVYKRRLIRDD